MQRFMHYAWPGNVRELEHAIEHAFILCRGQVITIEHLPEAIRASAIEGGSGEPADVSKKIFRRDQQDILDALERSGGNKTRAARLLGVNRRTIYRRISKDH